MFGDVSPPNIDRLLTRGKIFTVEPRSTLRPLHHSCDFSFSTSEIAAQWLSSLGAVWVVCHHIDLWFTASNMSWYITCTNCCQILYIKFTGRWTTQIRLALKLFWICSEPSILLVLMMMSEMLLLLITGIASHSRTYPIRIVCCYIRRALMIFEVFIWSSRVISWLRMLLASFWVWKEFGTFKHSLHIFFFENVASIIFIAAHVRWGLERIDNVLLLRLVSRELALRELWVRSGRDSRLKSFDNLLFDVKEVMMLKARKLG